MEKPNIVEIKAIARTIEGGDVAELRSNDLIPAVVYGPKLEKNIHVSVPRLAIEKVLSVKNLQFIKLEVEDGKTIDVFLKNTQFHPINDQILHVDFLALDPKTPVTVTIPIRLKGTSPGVIEGGRLYQSLRKIMVQALPKDLPAELTLDISKLKIGHNLKIRSLKLGGIQPLMSPERTILVIRPPKGGKAKLEEFTEEEEAEAAAAAEATSEEKA
ncbi:MAG TPA: 50S ribosomal protein L25 [Bacteroidetes bacterium]|nr:50S ribosomal protein L25 [Bacteroidota bacterium]